MVTAQAENERDDSCQKLLALGNLLTLDLTPYYQHVETCGNPHGASVCDVKEPRLVGFAETSIAFRNVEYQACRALIGHYFAGNDLSTSFACTYE